MNRAKNKGEHGETFSFLKLLVNTSFHFYGVAKAVAVKFVERDDGPKGESNTYTPWDSQTCCIKKNDELIHIPDYPRLVQDIYTEFKSLKNPGRSFELQAENKLLDLLKISKQKASNLEKFDCKIMLDLMDCFDGWSVKCKWGGYASLVNASSHTFLRYTIENCSLPLDDLLQKQAAFFISHHGSRHKKFGQWMDELGCSWKFHSAWSESFATNLGPALPIYAELFANYYLKDSTPHIRKLIPSGVGVYSYEECCRYLGEVFHCFSYDMIPSVVYNPDNCKTTPGGLIMVEKDEIHFRRVQSPGEYRKYLLDTSMLDTPSKVQVKEGKVKVIHKTGQLSEKDGVLFIDLVTGIRF